MVKEEPLRSIAKGAIIVFVGVFISKIFSFLYRLIVARVGAQEYGTLSIALAVYGMVVIAALLGINQGILRNAAYYKSTGEEKKLKGAITGSLKITTLTSIFLAAGLFIFSDKIAVGIFKNEQLGILLKIISFVIPFDVLRSNLFSIARVFDKIKYETYAKNITENSVKVIITIVLLWLGFGIVGATWAFAVAILVSFILIAYYTQKKVYPILRNKVIAIENNIALLVYSVPLVLNTLILLAINWTDTIILGIYSSAEDVGIYNSAVPTAQLTYVVTSAILSLFLPILTHLYAQKKDDEFKGTFKVVTKWIILANLIPLTLFIIMPEEVLGILFGKVYMSGGLALSILTIGYFIHHLALTANNTLLVFKKTNTVFIISLIGAILNLTLNILLIPSYGIIGASIATAISLFAIAATTIFIARKTTKINQFDSRILRAIIAVSLSAILLILVKSQVNEEILRLMFGGGVFIASYLALLLITKTLEREDLVFISLIQTKTGIRIEKLNRIVRRFL